MNKEDNRLIDRTPNGACPACQKGRLHEDHELKAHHPFARHGYAKETGWTHPELKKIAEERNANPKG